MDVREVASKQCFDRDGWPDLPDNAAERRSKSAALRSAIITALTILPDISYNHFTPENTDCPFVVHSLIKTM